MVNVGKLKKPMKGKGVPPAPEATRGNLGKPPSGSKVPMQLKLNPELVREYRIYAVEHDQELSTLFETVWRFYRKHNG